ncbi:MAG: beta-propeller domain-containing protein [bacterium]|nr:beta-propeller domain-containing protein [bacterium]
MKNIELILEEIYKVDPLLKDRDTEVRKLVAALLETKPEVQIDEVFITNLKNNLRAEMKPQKAQLFNYIRLNTYRLAGSLATILILVIAIPVLNQYLQMQNPVLISEPNGKIINTTDNIVTVKSDNGIVSKDSKSNTVLAGFVKFKSEAEYKEYLQNQDYGGGIGGERMMTTDVGPIAISAPGVQMSLSNDGSSGKTIMEVAPNRVSDTNVQVAGIDEPDIVKTDGKRIFLAPQNYYYYRGGPQPMMEGPTIGVAPEIKIGGGTSVDPGIIPENKPKVQVLQAFPPEALEKVGQIMGKSGNLLLSNNVLIVLGDREITGFDVTDPKNPKEKWNVKLDDKNSLVQSRLYNGQIYLITSTYSNKYDSCVIPLFTAGTNKVTVMCDTIYHPSSPITVNTTYHISTINVSSGALSKKVSFVGSYNSTVYMSKDNLFVAYAHSGDLMSIYYGFLNENKDMFPASIIKKVAELKTYNISESSKLNEMQTAISEYVSSLSNDDELKFNNEMQNRGLDYFKKHKRELTKTDIVKIALNDFSVNAMGSIPGSLLNQFSLDEYNGYLRAAVTIGNSFGMGFGGVSNEQENDVYVLDNNLNISGSVTGLGENERIYSARFIEDKGYLVTFRQTDPFYVLDLKNPKQPKMVGELKIPGFSSYLHPITKDLILGVGMESSKVKISLFDVSNPTKPIEISKYSLDEYWTEVSSNYHAFLQDSKHKIFFMPGSQGGYVFSYENNNLVLKKAVSDIQAKRALFINDYLYIIGDTKVTVLNENTWEKVTSLEL